MEAPCLSDDIVVERVDFRAGAIELQGELIYPESAAPRGKVILAGPHPLLGGTMRNNVIREVGDGLAMRGMACLRFEYRDLSTADMNQLAEFWRASRCDAEAEYQEDLRAAGAFLDAAVGGLPLALVGYSFGCALLPAVSRPTDPLVLIAPAVGPHGLAGFAGRSRPALVISPRDDFAADEALLLAWFDRLPAGSELLRPRLDGHFFRGHEAWLTATICDHLDLQLALGSSET